MAIRMISFFLAGLYLAGLGLAAPTMPMTIPSSLTSDTIPDDLTTTQAAAEELDFRRMHIFRLDMTAWSRLSAKTAQAPKYILDATLGLFETNADNRVVPVFAMHMNKTVIIDANGELLATYGEGKFVPVWARPWKTHRFRGASRFSETLAVFILGFSLSIALVCAFCRSLCPKQDDRSASCEPDIVERAMAANDNIEEGKGRIATEEEYRD